MQKRRTTHDGFTLVEVIVTLVVLGILAGVGVPAMTGWIDDTRTKTCAANRASLLESYAAFRAVRRISVTEADSNFSNFLSSEGSLGQEPSCPSGGAYALVGNAAVTCTVHSMQGMSMDARVALSTALAKLDKPVGSYDSGAPDKFLGSSVKGQATNKFKLLAAVPGLADALTSAGIQAWSIGNANSSGKRVFIWTDQDIQSAALNTWVRAYRYNEAYSAYTVGYVKVVESNSADAMKNQLGQYHIISFGNWVEANQDAKGNTILQNDGTKKSFTSSADLFPTLMASSDVKPAGK